MSTTTPPRPKPAKRKPVASAANRAGAKGLLAAAAAGAAGTLPLDLIEPDHFTNPRGPVDHKSPGFLELVASVTDIGLLEPIVVGPALVAGGKHPVIAGWRRYAAATVAKLPAVPVHQVAITDAKDALVAALAENIARDDMTPLAEARAIDTLMGEHGYTQVAAGKAVGMAERTVRERLRLLKIHTAAPVVGAAIDSGAVPMDAAVMLEQIANVAPNTAAAMVAGVGHDVVEQVTDPWTASDLAKPEEVDQVICWMTESAHDPDIAAALGPIDRLHSVYPDRDHTQIPGDQLPLTDDQRDRWWAIQDGYAHQWNFRLEASDIAAARKAGQLLEIEGANRWNQQSATWIVDAYFTTDWLETRLQDLEHKAAEAKAKTKNAARQETAKEGEVKPGLTEAEARAATEAKAKDARERELAHHRNAILGERSRGDRFADLALSLEAAKFFALLILHSGAGSLLERGVRYCDPEHLTETEQKNGKVKRTYQLTAPEDTGVGRRTVVDQLLLDKVRNATTARDALAPVLRAYLLAHEADETVVAQSNRAYFHLPYSNEDKLGDHIHAIAVDCGLLGDVDTEAQQRADAGGRPLSEVLAEPATSPVKLTGSRKDQALALVTARPGITIPELADAMSLNQNVLYRILPGLAQEGKVEKRGRGWHPNEASA